VNYLAKPIVYNRELLETQKRCLDENESSVSSLVYARWRLFILQTVTVFEILASDPVSSRVPSSRKVAGLDVSHSCKIFL
jgi:hypothetical protein